jgi:phage terminase small subunit
MPGSKTPKPNAVRAGRRVGELTDKQRRFIAEYLVDSNATQAAIRAGFSRKTAHVQGPRLLGKVSVRAEVDRRQKAIERRLEVSAQAVLGEYAKVGGSRITDYLRFGPKGVTIRASDDIPERQLDAISEVSERIGPGGQRLVTLKLHNKLGALDAMGKHLGLFVERHEHDLGARLSDALTTIKARLSPAAQEELVRAVGHVMAAAVAPGADESAGEPSV